jgi:hypothetical protein
MASVFVRRVPLLCAAFVVYWFGFWLPIHPSLLQRLKLVFPALETQFETHTQRHASTNTSCNYVFPIGIDAFMNNHSILHADDLAIAATELDAHLIENSPVCRIAIRVLLTLKKRKKKCEPPSCDTSFFRCRSDST